MLLLFQILSIDFVFTLIIISKKEAYFEWKFIKDLMELTWVESNHLEVFWKMDTLRS